MDAAQYRKIALYLSTALLLAGAASAQNLQVSTNSVQFPQFGQTSFTIDVASSGSTPVTFQIQNKTASWFSVSSSPGLTTPATVTVTRTNTTCGAALGPCSAGFDLVGSANTQHIDVVYNATGGGGGTSGLSSSQNPISLSVSAAGFSAVASPVISTTSTSAVNVTISQTPTAGQWLFVSPSGNSAVSASVPLTLNVVATAPAGSINQTLTGSVTITPTSGAPALNIPVTLVVGTGSVTGSLIPNPTTISLAYPSGNTAQTLTVSHNTGANVSFTATTNSASGWLTINNSYSTNGITPTFFTVGVNSGIAASLGTGTYSGTITLSTGSDFTQVPVSLVVNGGGGGGTTSGTAAPTTLNFVYEQQKASPPCQQVLIPYTGTFTVTPSGSPAFLYTSGGEITAPGTVLVCAAVAGLAPGSYTNSIAIQSTSLGIFQAITANLTVYGLPVLIASANSPTATDNGVIGCFFQTGVRGCNDSQLNARLSDGSNADVNVTSSASWVTVDPATGTTPASFNVKINASSLPSGVNSATITVSGAGANSSVVVPVVVQVNGGTSGGGGGTGVLTYSTSTLNFSAAGSQNLTVSAASATSITASTPSNCGWLSIQPGGALTTPQTIAVTVNSSGLTAGQTYSCSVSFTTSGSTQTVAVNFTVPSGPTGNVTVDKTRLDYTSTTGSNPAAQTLSVSSASGTIPFTVSVQPSGSWLSVSPTAGTASTTGTAVTVSVAGTALATGAHSGFVYITPNGGQTVQIPVTVIVSAATTVSATPTTLNFSYIAGNANPASQQLTVSGTGNNLNFTATVTSGNEWLSVLPATGTTPGTVDVRVTPGSLNPGTYTGTIVVAGAGGATGSTTTTVNLTVTAPLPTISRVTNGASFNSGPISAGEIITLFGVAMGPGTIQGATPSGGVYPTTLGGVQVHVGGDPAPLIYVRNDQIAAVVPYEINRPFIANPTVVVRYLGQTSNGVTLQQVGAMPGIFTTGGGTGQGAILNANLSVNSAANAAAKGETVVLYVTGEGVTNPAGVSGRITPSTTPFPQPVSGIVTVTIDGQPATVTFYGEAPGLIAGVMQVNVTVPAGASTGSVPVVVRVGDAASQLDSSGRGAVTVAVR